MSQARFSSNPNHRSALLGLLLGLWLSGCQNSTPQPLSTSVPPQLEAGFRLGVLVPLSGELAPTGRVMLEALPWLVAEVNTCGGVNNAPVVLVVEDTLSSSTARIAMAKLAEIDHVQAVVTASLSTDFPNAIDVAVRQRIPILSATSTSMTLTKLAQSGQFEGYWARTIPSDGDQARALAKLAIAKGLKQASTVVVNNDYGVGFEQAFVAAFEALGGTVLNKAAPVRYDVDKTSDLDSEAIAAFRDSPDVVVAALEPQTGSLLLRSAHEQKLIGDAQVLLTDQVHSEIFIQKVGKQPDGTFVLAGAFGITPIAHSPALTALEKRWSEKEQTPLKAPVSYTWDAAALLILAAEAADANQGEAIQKKLREVANSPGTAISDICQGLELLRNGQEINYQGAGSAVDINVDGDVTGVYDVWIVGKDGKFQVVQQITPPPP